MPSYTRGEERDVLTYVRVNSATSIYHYGWKAKDISKETDISEADLLALGHIKRGSLPQGSVYTLRAQSPKPGRATKRIRKNPGPGEKGSVSTFYGAGFLSAALGAGWSGVKRPKSVSLKNKARYVTAIAKLSNGSHYVFPMNKTDFVAYKAALGLLEPQQITTTQERESLVRGCSIPRPGRVSKDIGNGQEFSSFFSTDAEDAALAAEFGVVEREYIG